MAYRILPTIERLHELFVYEPETGLVPWRRRTHHNQHPDLLAGWRQATGYIAVRADDVDLLVHRVIWAMETFDWPLYDVDHRNGIRNDNRFLNLREALQGENHQNKGRLSTNRSGFQ